MSRAMKTDLLAGKFDLPAGLLRAEQRLAERALRLWQAGGQTALAGFEAQELRLADPAGRSEIVQVADEIGRTFGLAVGQMLALDPALPPHGLGVELRAACDLVALGGRPVPFAASVSGREHGLILVRGIALPIPGEGVEGGVQVVLSWREVLNRSAAARLKRELGQALAGPFLQGASQGRAVDALPLGRLPLGRLPQA